VIELPTFKLDRVGGNRAYEKPERGAPLISDGGVQSEL